MSLTTFPKELFSQPILKCTNGPAEQNMIQHFFLCHPPLSWHIHSFPVISGATQNNGRNYGAKDEHRQQQSSECAARSATHEPSFSPEHSQVCVLRVLGSFRPSLPSPQTLPPFWCFRRRDTESKGGLVKSLVVIVETLPLPHYPRGLETRDWPGDLFPFVPIF